MSKSPPLYILYYKKSLKSSEFAAFFLFYEHFYVKLPMTFVALITVPPVTAKVEESKRKNRVTETITRQ